MAISQLIKTRHIFLATFLGIYTGTGEANSTPVQTSLFQFLTQVADEYNAHFGVEIVIGVDGVPNPEPVISENVHPDISGLTVPQFVEYLQNTLLNFDVYIADLGLRSFNVVDKKTATISSYPLTQPIASFSFIGTPWGLVDQLHQENASIRQKMQFEIGAEPITSDTNTQVTLMKENTSIRMLLQSAVSTAGYSRIMWIAEVVKMPSQVSCFINFWGPSKYRTPSSLPARR